MAVASKEKPRPLEPSLAANRDSSERQPQLVVDLAENDELPVLAVQVRLHLEVVRQGAVHQLVHPIERPWGRVDVNGL